MNHRYQVELEIAGRAALYARPDTGGTPISYPLPTFSACKATFESIALLSGGEAWFRPTKVAVCKRINSNGKSLQPSLRWMSYTTNYGGPLRKSNQVSGGNNMQLIATALAEPCFRITAAIEGNRPTRGRNPRHYLKHLFERRLRQGRAFRTPCLGWSEFTADYWGEFRDGGTRKDGSIRPLRSAIDQSVSMVIPTMLHSVWDCTVNGRPSATFIQNATIDCGVLEFPEELPKTVSPPSSTPVGGVT